MRLRTRLFLTHASLTAASIVIVGACAIWFWARYVVSSTQADLSARATALSANVTDWLERNDRSRVETIVRRYGAQEDVWLRVIDPDGHLIATSSPRDDRHIGDWRGVPGVSEALAGRDWQGVGRGVNSTDERIIEARPLMRNGHSYGVLRIARTLASVRARQRWSFGAMAAMLAGALALCTLVSLWLARALSKPVDRMRATAAAIGRGEFGHRVGETRDDELGELGRAIDTMSARLASLDDDRRAFLARASHELRTPLTNVVATLEALESGAGDEPQLRARFTKTALDEVRRLAHLVESMLDLGRIEAGVTEIERRPVDLEDMLLHTVEPLVARFAAANVTLERRLAHGVWCDGDPQRLQRVVLNILDNALRHTPAGRTVIVSLRREGPDASIEVRDGGEGFDPAGAAHAFDEFFAANRGSAHGGSGLGLAIARRIVDAHGGHIAASNAPDKGGIVTVTLPARANS